MKKLSFGEVLKDGGGSDDYYRAEDVERVIRNLLREYCANTKLEPWSPDWQCEIVVRDAVKLLDLKYGDKL